MKLSTIVPPLLLGVLVSCNTEIINVKTSSTTEPPVEVSLQWPLLQSVRGKNARIFQVQSNVGCKNTSLLCPGEFWAALETGEQRQNDILLKPFALRLSWAASDPVSFEISLFKPPASHNELHALSHSYIPWRQYVRVRATNTGVGKSGEDASVVRSFVPFDMIMDPLFWGVIPQSIVPTVVSLLVIATVFTTLIKYILSHLSVLAGDITKASRKTRN